MLCRSTRFHRGTRSRLFAAVLLLCAVAPILVSAEASARSVQQITSNGGIKAWLVEEHGVPLIALQLAFVSGSVQDPQDKPGLTQLVAKMLDEGAGDLTAQDFKAQLASLAVRFSASATRSAIRIGLAGTTTKFLQATDLLRQALMQPRFDESALAEVKQQILTGIAFESEEGATIALRQFYARAFAGHPLSRPVDGTAAVIKSISANDVRDHFKRVVARKNLRVVLVGDISANRAGELLDNVFGGLQPEPNLKTVLAEAPKTVSTRITLESAGGLANAIFAYPAPGLNDPDFYAALTLNHILGSGNFDARLTEEIRVKRSLTYAVASQVSADAYSSLIVGAMSTKAERMDEALDVLRETYARIVAEGPTASELTNAKTSLVATPLLAIETSPALARHLLSIQVDGWGPDSDDVRRRRIEKLTLADIKRVAKKILQPGSLSTVVVGPSPQRSQ